jgi:hypothetical protein
VSTYYPSGVLQLLLRLDDGVTPLPPDAVAALQGALGSQVVPATDLQAFSPVADGYSVLGAILPSEVTHERNTPREADVVTIRVPFRDFPLPARIVRSIGVVWYAGTVSAANYAAGLRNSFANKDGKTGPLLSVLTPSRQNLRFVGFADGAEEDYDAGVITIRARDYTGVLLDERVKPDVLKSIEIDQALDLVILSLLRQFPGGACRGLTVEFSPFVGENGAEQEFPNVAQVLGKPAKFRRGKAPSLSATYGGADVSYWDLLTDLCSLCGYLPTIEEDRLRVLPPRNLFTGQGTFRRTVTTPSGSTEVLTARRMVQGHNVDSVRFARKFGRQAIPAIEVRSVAPGLRQPIVSRFPPDSATPRTKANNVQPSGRGASERSELVLIRGVSSQAEVDRIARGLWQELARQEWTGSYMTKHLASVGGDNDNPDLLDLRAGDPLELVLQRAGASSGVLLSIANLQTRGAQIDALVRRGISQPAAIAIADVYSAARALGSTFRTRTVTYSWQLGGAQPRVQVSSTVGTYLAAPVEDPVEVAPVRAVV